MSPITIGLIGMGRMGSLYLKELLLDKTWNIKYICDVSEESRQWAHQIAPQAKVIADEDEILQIPQVQVVGLFALADSRPDQIGKCVKYGKHFMCEKPIADTEEHETDIMNMIKGSSLISTVNLYLRNSWYHHKIKEFIDEGEIGELAIIRLCHMTPGLAPGEGHAFEGPGFHDCGMHYVDIARWYANSEYKSWHAQGLKMWSYKEPWWVSCHGTFENGVVFDITQGQVYGQLSVKQTHNSYVDIIGTKGIVRMTHDFNTAEVELHGITKTETIKRPYGGKNIDVSCKLFAESVLSGHRNEHLPRLEDAAIASHFAWVFYRDSLTHDLPSIGNLDTLEEIKRRRKTMVDGYGLLRHCL